MIFELGGMKPGLIQMVRFRFISREEMPMDVRIQISIAGIIHFPGIESVYQRASGFHQFLEQGDLDGGLKLVQFSDVVFQKQQRIAAMELMVTNNKKRMLKLTNDMGILSALPERYSLAD